MGPCCVEGCEITEEETFYFEFPTSRLLRRKWLDVIPIPGKLPLGTVVCSRHFSREDYESVRGKVRLKSKVVPSLLLEEKPKPPIEISQKVLACDSNSEQTPTEDGGEKKDGDTQKTSDSVSDTSGAPSTLSETQGDTSGIQLTVGSHTSDTNGSDTSGVRGRRRGARGTTSRARGVVRSDTSVSDTRRHSTEMAVIYKVVHKENGRGDCNVLKSPPLPDPKEDIEDMITNYHIKNKLPNTALLPDSPPPGSGGEAGVERGPGGQGGEPGGQGGELGEPGGEPIEIEDGEADPVFIEISVDKEADAGAGSQDCLMLLESVQVEVDPSSLMLPEREFEHDDNRPHKREDPISLLTSSDEDDVILQEPHIDTVEVSDETDEDDVPLVKLLKKKTKKKLKKRTKKIEKKQKENFENVTWGMYEFYCMQCHFTTKDSMEYNHHVSEHSTVLQICRVCGYTTASKSMLTKHAKKHRGEKKYRCHICDYRARHNMSLIYHLQSHESANLKSVKRGFKCKKCGFRSDVKATVLKHCRLCSSGQKKYSCDKCVYETKRRSDLKRHTLRRHKEVLVVDDNVAELDCL